MAAARNRSRRATAEAPDQRGGADAARWASQVREASDAAPYAERLAALYAAVADTILILERAQPLPADHEHGPNAWEAYLCTVGNQRFAAALTGSLDTPARHYIVTTTSDDEEGPGANGSPWT